jgi:hypothetical protein
MPSTLRWNPATLDDFAAVQFVFALSGHGSNALASDLGLYKAGWITSTAYSVALFLGSTGITTSEYRHILPRGPIDFVQVKPVATGQSLLAAITAEGTIRASSGSLLVLVEGLFELIGSRQFDEVDLLLQIDPADVAPEVSVGILRVTSNYARSLQHWSDFLEKTREDFKRRGLSPDPILVGLSGGDNQLDQRAKSNTV